MTNASKRLATLVAIALAIPLIVATNTTTATAAPTCTSPITVLTEADLAHAIGCYNTLATEQPGLCSPSA